MSNEKEECFVIMPISDPDGYDSGHFQHVYDDIIGPACDTAGYEPVRADDVLETNFIHLDVLKRILETPMAVCDLSTRNPNVLFELGMRQAFDKPVVLIQEEGTERVFDIAPLRSTEYRKERIYHQVLEDQKSIAAAIEATKKATANNDGINSMVSLLSLTSSATLKEVTHDDQSPALQYVMAEIDALRRDVQEVTRIGDKPDSRNTHNGFVELERLRNMVSELEQLVEARVADPGGLTLGPDFSCLYEECHKTAHQLSSNRRYSNKVRWHARRLREKVSDLSQHLALERYGPEGTSEP